MASRRRRPDLFDDTRTCFLMIGHTKSGGTLLGSMLDAHPQVVGADELGLARLLIEGKDRDAAFRLAVRNAERELARGRVTSRRVEAYSLHIPGWYQGSLEGGVVAVGDSRAGPTTRYLASRTAAMAELEEVLGEGVALRLIQVVRNPFDPIAFMVARSGRTLTDAIGDYRAQCERVAALAAACPEGALEIVHYEDLVADTKAVLGTVCEFLGVEPHTSYLDACSAIVEGERQERSRVPWSATDREAVEDIVSTYSFLAGYAYGGA